MLCTRASTSQWMIKFMQMSPITMRANISFYLLARKYLYWTLCSKFQGFQVFFFKQYIDAFNTKNVNLYYSFFHRKYFTLISAEIPEKCNKSFESDFGFGSAYTFVISRKVSNSFHYIRSSTPTFFFLKIYFINLLG